jgi:DNA processing protein
MYEDRLKYWMALKSIPGIGNAIFSSLVERFGSPEAVFSASVAALCSVSDMNKNIAGAIVSFPDWDSIMRQIEAMNKSGINIITFRDELYPANLLNIYDRPVFLYVKGTLRQEDVPVAVVGSRRASTYGKYTTERMSRELALQGVTIVSGMARGIDTSAHRGALSVSGRTIAVLGSGLDVIYPPENKNLFSDIAQNGAVISEFPPGTEPLPFNFPARNRIISGMSYGVLVVEAGEKSGSLITARLAMEQGRDVFAIPGAIDSASSRGANSLIKQGAKLVDTIDDILEDILPQVEYFQPRQSIHMSDVHEAKPPMKAEKRPVAAGGVEQSIAGILLSGEMHADEIITSTNLAPAAVMSALITMELKGIIEQHPGKLFSLKK